MNTELLDDLDYLEEASKTQIYIGFWTRLGAALLDLIILSIIHSFWSAILGMVGLVIPTIINEVDYFGTAAISFLYFPLMESSKWQASIGKQIFGIKVVDSKGEGLNFGQALLRLLAKGLSCSIAYLGFVMIAFTSKKRGLHDLIVDTYVVER
ncbi:RDD family protein [Aureispira sp. CCB-QB1]|uniref:RDD family protein n=1 Tax=Aureispira sp. CCB-QB1 TaxID=1313421 RepID=UPI00069755BC|nr:RDD family protein [Aureispira sp. CCB-QB1]